MEKLLDVSDEEWDEIIKEGQETIINIILKGVIEVTESSELSKIAKDASYMISFNSIIPSLLNEVGMKVYDKITDKFNDMAGEGETLH